MKNPIQVLLDKGITRKEMALKTRLSLPAISMVLTESRGASLKIRKAFYDAYAISPWEWPGVKKRGV